MNINSSKNYTLYIVILFFLLGLNLISSQNQSKRYLDSIYHINKIDRLKSAIKNQNLNDKDKMWAYRGLSWNYIEINKDSTFHYAELRQSHYVEKRDTIGLVRTFLDYGRLLGKYNELEDGIAYFEKALAYHKNLPQRGNYMLLCEELGNFYTMQSRYQPAIRYYQDGLASAKLQGSKLYQGYFSSYLSRSYTKIGQLELGHEYIQSALNLFVEVPNMRQHAYAMINLGNVYYEMESFELAEKSLLEAEDYFISDEQFTYTLALTNIYSLLGRVSFASGNETLSIERYLKAKNYAFQLVDRDENLNFILGSLHNYLGNAYLEVKKTNDAIDEFYASLSVGKELNSLEILTDSYKGLYTGYLDLREVDSVKQYMSLFESVNDSLVEERYNNKLDELIYENELTTEKEKHQNELEISDLSKRRQQLYFGIIALLLVSGFIIIAFLGYAQRSKAQEVKIKNDNLNLEKENLTLKLDKKERELTASVLNLVERNEFISRLMDDLKQISFDEEQAQQIKDIIKSTSISDSKKLWEEFELRYSQNNELLFNKLNKITPNITTNEKRLVALIMLNFSTKEISSITYQSPHSIKIARYRLRKKLGVSKNKNLIQFFSSL